MLLQPKVGPEIDILHHSKKAVKTFLEKALRYKILKEFSKELQGETPRRKDMTELDPMADRRTTLNLFRAKKSPINDLPLQMFKRIHCQLEKTHGGCVAQ